MRVPTLALLAFASGIVMAGPRLSAATMTVTGTVSDAMCGAHHPVADAAGCTARLRQERLRLRPRHDGWQGVHVEGEWRRQSRTRRTRGQDGGRQRRCQWDDPDGEIREDEQSEEMTSELDARVPCDKPRGRLS